MTERGFSRREFIWASSCAWAGFARFRGAASQTIRIGTLVDPAHPELERGLRFGFAESARSIALFGWTLERTTLRRGAVSTPQVQALILGTAREVSTTLPVLRCVRASGPIAGGELDLRPPSNRMS